MGVCAQYRRLAWTGTETLDWLEGEDQHGKAWSMRQLRGKVVVLNFWATWCPPCVEELPSLQALNDGATDHRVVLAVNVKETPGRVRRYLEASVLDLPTLFDRKGDWGRRLGIQVLPTTLVVGPDGKPRFSVQGAVDWNGAQARAWLSEAASHPPLVR